MNTETSKTHLVAHVGTDGTVLVAEHSSEDDDYGYQFGDVETLAGDDDPIAALAAAGYRISSGWEFDTFSGERAARVEKVI